MIGKTKEIDELEMEFSKENVEKRLKRSVNKTKTILPCDRIVETHLLKRFLNSLTLAERKFILDCILNEFRDIYCYDVKENKDNPHYDEFMLPYFDIRNKNDRDLFAMIASCRVRDLDHLGCIEYPGMVFDEILKSMETGERNVIRKEELNTTRDIVSVNKVHNSKWVETVNSISIAPFPIIKKFTRKWYNKQKAAKAKITREKNKNNRQ